MKKVITYGTFDLLHNGHLNILKKAKQLGDYLIVGITSDNYDRQRGKLNVIQSVSERIENVKKTGLADKIIVEEYDGQKIDDIQKNKVDIFAIGSDWEGKFDYLNEYCKVVYLPRTKGISSTVLRGKKYGITKLGIIGYGNIASRFVKESKFVSGHNIEVVFGLNKSKGKKFIEKYGINYFTNNFQDFLQKIDAIYIASPHHTHYEYAKKGLLHNKHILSEKPLCFNKNKAIELFNLAKERELILLEGIKTAFFPGFLKLLGIVKSGKIGKILEVDATFTKLIEDDNRREFTAPLGGSFTELLSYPLLAIIKILGTNYKNIYSFPIYNKNNIDIYGKVIFNYQNSIGTGTVGLKGKKEGDLVIVGTKGYIYVPSPRWLTNYFEIRNNNGETIERITENLHGDGLRYELAEFLKLINNKQLETYKLKINESITIAEIFEKVIKNLNNNNNLNEIK